MQVSLQNLSARHPAAKADSTPAVRSLSLAFAAGEQVAVIGPSGAGKPRFACAGLCAQAIQWSVVAWRKRALAAFDL
ncbi:MAG: hypothetical protein HC765_13085 [Brachymonas sp.]|nr:hypothetical protein [Brachymonas sp.]